MMNGFIMLGGVLLLAGILLLLVNPVAAAFCLIIGGGLVAWQVWFRKRFSS